MPEPGAVQKQLVVALAWREGFGPCGDANGMTNLAPQMRPVQNASRIGKVTGLLALDPGRPIGQHDHRLGRPLLHVLSRPCRQLAQVSRWAKGGHIPSLDQAMAWLGCLARTALAPGKGGTD